GASFAVENWAAAGFWKQLIQGLDRYKNRECPDLRLAFFTWHDRVEDQHAAHTMDELRGAFERPGFDQEKFLQGADEMLNGVKVFWDGLEARRTELLPSASARARRQTPQRRSTARCSARPTTSAGMVTVGRRSPCGSRTPPRRTRLQPAVAPTACASRRAARMTKVSSRTRPWPHTATRCTPSWSAMSILAFTGRATAPIIAR